ncbi:hypothetical protein VE26_13530 [Devosia chinhatensis]|uniref:Uncharacterized protein n=2 Tax=Devosia chinhatensis TaxID=429727 RepID=A0A0F5FFY5_9HYPH|nr:hypothetical protein VE26_13530 [Devosia chinhatensis]
MSEQDHNETERIGLPQRVAPASARPSLARSAPDAAFVSQLIAARDRLSPQRTRSSDPGSAAFAYGRGARMAERRMPMGYRKTKLA